METVRTDIPGLYRESNGGLINRDTSSLMQYKNRKQQSMRLSTIEKKLETLTAEMNSIKSLLEKLTNEDKIK